MIDADEYDDDGSGPWCKDVDGHAVAHRFCVDHQASWCLTCEGQCSDCIDDPHCRECHAALHEEDHDWDCSYAGESGDDED